jgi:putative heme-binding domain-containing protein
MAEAKLSKPAPLWRAALADVVTRPDAKLRALGVAAARALPPTKPPGDALDGALARVAAMRDTPPDVRVAALAAAAPSLSAFDEQQFRLLIGALGEEASPETRAAAVDALTRGHLSPAQLVDLCEPLKAAGPLEINQLLAAFADSDDDETALQLVESLKSAAALSSLRVDELRRTLDKRGLDVQQKINELESLTNVDAAAQRKRIEELLPEMAHGDVRRGHAVFYSSKALCSSCHRLGNAGGTVGPDLSRIGEARTERDLLESILFPSLSFVRSYEPVLIITVDGRVISGTIFDQTADEYVIATGPDKEQRVRRDEVEELQPGTVSVMPAGLDKQFTTQELADLVAFLKNTGAKK